MASRRFPPTWRVVEMAEWFVVQDATGQNWRGSISDLLISEILRCHQFVVRRSSVPGISFGGVELIAEMSMHCLRMVGERVETDGECFSLRIRHDVSLCAVDGPQQAAGIVMTLHLLAQYLHHGCFSPVGDHLDGVDEVLALGA